MKYVISHNIPIPPKKVRDTFVKKYPFENMQIGDSFHFGGDDKPQTIGYIAAVFSRRQNPPWQFTTRKTNDGYRIWRIK